jgi:two-component system, NarL family, sensor histidine kinase DesK
MGERNREDGPDGCSGAWGRGLRGQRAGRYGGLAWIAIWMWPLISPAVATARGRVHPTVPAAVGLIAFAVLYMAVMALAWSDRPPARSRLLTLLGLVAALGLALAAGYADGPDGWLVVLLFVGVAGAAALRPPVHVFGWLSGVVAALVAIGLLRGVGSGELGSTAFSVFMSGVLVFVVRRMNLLIDQLRATQAELAEAAVSQERLRFSRDLHDLLGHTLSVIVVKAAVVRRLAERDPPLAGREAGEIEEIGRRALVEVREAVTGYRDRTFGAELDGARKALAGAGIEVTVRESGDPLPSAVETVFGWAVREGVTNVIRHSGARRCEIDLQLLDGQARIEIRDDGVGSTGTHDGGTGSAGTRYAGAGLDDERMPDYPAARGSGGHGLRGIAERVRAAGGTFEAGECAGGGFRLAAEIPAVAGEVVPGRWLGEREAAMSGGVPRHPTQLPS